MHAADPLPGTAYTTDGPYALRELDERIARAFPATAHCSCGGMLRRETQADEWKHAGRKPGEG
jgi:hypothetical protein